MDHAEIGEACLSWGEGSAAMDLVGRGRGQRTSDLNRRDFLKAGGLGAMASGLAGQQSAMSSTAVHERAVILVMLVGGPSQLETFDPKPDAPADVRGPFRSIATTVPGVRLGEHLPRLARRMDHFTIIRSLHHDAAPIHETGQQLLQTGRLCRLGQEHPHIGAVVARLGGARSELPPFVMVPGPIGQTGVEVSHGQTAGVLGPEYDAVQASSADLPMRARKAFDLRNEPGSVRDAYGRTTFGQSCLLARRLVEAGVRLVTVNMYESVFNRVSWDCHGREPFSTLDDYAREVMPTFDVAFSALLDDLAARGLLDTTMVVATGEFGRTPRINPAGGRDHWPGVWSAAVAGGGIRGGQVIGASDAHAAAPADRPVQPAELLATMYRALGIDPAGSLDLGEHGTLTLVDDARAITEAFA